MVLFTFLVGKYKLSPILLCSDPSPLIATPALWFIVWSIRWILTQICRVISQVIVVAVLAEINDAGIKDYIDVFIDTEK